MRGTVPWLEDTRDDEGGMGFNVALHVLADADHRHAGQLSEGIVTLEVRVRPSWKAPAIARKRRAGRRLARMFIVEVILIKLV